MQDNSVGYLRRESLLLSNFLRQSNIYPWLRTFQSEKKVTKTKYDKLNLPVSLCLWKNIAEKTEFPEAYYFLEIPCKTSWDTLYYLHRLQVQLWSFTPNKWDNFLFIVQDRWAMDKYLNITDGDSKVVSKKNSDLFSRLLQSPHCVEISKNVSFGIF